MTGHRVRNGFLLTVLVGAVLALLRSLRGGPMGAVESAEGPVTFRPAAPSVPVAAVPATIAADVALATEPDEPAAEVQIGEAATLDRDEVPEQGLEPQATPTAAWVPPVDGQCPDGYPVKLKLSSGIFHVPGGLSYDRTIPDRCYKSAEAAEQDGHRQAKR